MWENDPTTRRTLVKVGGGAVATALLAGCTDGGGEGGDGDGNGSDGGDGGGDADPSEWEDVDTVMFEAYTQGWEGVEPSPIEGEENPTIVMFEGESYTLGWQAGDGAGHNIEIRDDNDEVVEDYSTEVESGDDVEQELEIDEVTSEMAQYVCQPHSNTMRGDIQVESNGGGGGGDENASNETEENASNETEENASNETDE